MRKRERNPGMVDGVDVKRAAHHEAGHIVVAAANELRLLPAGLCINSLGAGFASYCKPQDGSDFSLERVIVAAFVGVFAEIRFCAEYGFPAHDRFHDPDYYKSYIFSGPGLLSDQDEVLQLLGITMETYKRSSVVRALQRQSELLVEQHWLAIKVLSTVLLSKDWAPLNVDMWPQSNEATTKCVSGEEAVSILGQYGIAAMCAVCS